TASHLSIRHFATAGGCELPDARVGAAGEMLLWLLWLVLACAHACDLHAASRPHAQEASANRPQAGREVGPGVRPPSFPVRAEPTERNHAWSWRGQSTARWPPRGCRRRRARGARRAAHPRSHLRPRRADRRWLGRRDRRTLRPRAGGGARRVPGVRTPAPLA